MPNQEPASARIFGNSSVRVGTQGLFCPTDCPWVSEDALALIHELLGLGVKGNRPLTVIYGSDADGDLVLIQTFLPYYVNQVILMLN